MAKYQLGYKELHMPSHLAKTRDDTQKSVESV